MDAALRRLIAAAVAATGTTDVSRIADWVMTNRAGELRQIVAGFARVMLGGGEVIAFTAGRQDRPAEAPPAGDLF
jgi:hypothetical protein